MPGTEASDAGPIAVAGGFEWRRGPYQISTDPGRIDVRLVATFLASTYWARDIPETVVRQSIEHSVAFGIYHGADQVGFARVVTDRATFAWVGDVFVVDEHRGRGLARWLMECAITHPDLQGLRRWMLATNDAHALYAQVGFAPLAAPERFMEIADPGVYTRRRHEAEHTADSAED